MMKHDAVLRQLRAKAELMQENTPLDVVWSRAKLDDRILLSSTIVHMGDLSNPVLPFPICERFAKAVIEEFYSQTVREQEMAVKVTEFMSKKDNVSLCGLQASFIDFVCFPMWNLLHEMFPVGLATPMKNIRDNRAKWVELKEIYQLEQNSTSYLLRA
jgi:hypothetical protein